MRKLKSTGADHNQQLSIVLIPPAGVSPICLQIPYRLLKIAMVVLIVVGISTLGSLYLGAKRSADAQAYHDLKETSSARLAQFTQLSLEVQTVRKQLDQLVVREQQYRQMFGVAGKSESIAATPHQSGESSSALTLAERQLGEVKRQVARVKSTYDRLAKKAESFRIQFAETPSIWPINGTARISSDFGWRRHPLTHRFQFHKGIDIAGQYGVLVRATASGVVAASGWESGYGYRIRMTHGHGFSTVYGHLSKLLVTAGTRVNKGDVVGRMGSSGDSTGPHVHYEVRRWAQAIPPEPFLDLTLMTASTKIW